MADSKIPPTFKSLLPFIRRAEELERDSTRPESKLIAYYCRQYAMELGIKLRENDSSNESTNYLLSLMDRLEQDKSNLPTFTQDEGKEICEDFALEIFTKADDEDRAGNADKNTARTFYAAGTFFDILNQFGDVQEDFLEKRRYCKYKAATILKAIKEGVAPSPGPPDAGVPAGDNYTDAPPVDIKREPEQRQPVLPPPPSFPTSDFAPPASAPTIPSAPTHVPSTNFPSFTSSASNIGPGVSSAPAGHGHSWTPPPSTPASIPTQSAYPPPPQQQTAYAPPPPQQAAYTPQPPPPMVSMPPPPAAPTHAPFVQQTLPPRNRANPVSQNEINDAMECAKFAIAALKVKDIELAIQRLEMALKSIN